MLCFFSLVLFWASSFALDVPSLTGPVVDQAGLLTQEEKLQIESVLRNFKEQKGSQIQVLIVPSLEGSDIESYSIKVVDKWKLGNEKTDNGVLFLLALQDRKVRIEVGQGLEGELTDVKSSRIIRSITPYFKAGKFYTGIATALNEIIQVIDDGTFHNEQDLPQEHGGGFGLIIFLIILFIFVSPVLPFIPRSRGFRGGGWGGGSFGGGGGWSGGGGGFSGGGASGSW